MPQAHLSSGFNMWRLSNGVWFDDEFPFKNFVTTRSSGNQRDAQVRNRFLSESGINHKSVVLAQQVHGNKVVAVNNNHKGKQIPDADGLITAEQNLPLAIFTADCLPIFFSCRRKKAVGLVHAGWRGLAHNVISETISVFGREFEIGPEELFVSIGPHIQKCCYEVSKDLNDIFGVSQKEKNLELAEIAVRQLNENGVRGVSVNRNCTCHQNNLFFSFRREKTLDRMMSLVQI